jgi:hypothetical protein
VRLRPDRKANDKSAREEPPQKNFTPRYSLNVILKINFRLEQQKNGSPSIRIARDTDSKQTVADTDSKQRFIKELTGVGTTIDQTELQFEQTLQRLASEQEYLGLDFALE